MTGTLQHQVFKQEECHKVINLLLGPFSTIKNIPEVATKIPDLKIVINHIAKPFGSDFKTWAEEMTKASKFRNVYCKLSGLNDEVNFYDVDALRPYVQHCLGKIGL